jgi:molybdopterin converting factor small subunit
VKVLFYGRLAESIAPELEVDALPGSSVAQLRERLIDSYPEAEQPLRNHRSRACIGDTLVQEDHVLEAADTVEFLPPVSGG